MISKIKTKLSNMSVKDWITLGLWSITFIVLIAFVIAAATIDHSSSTAVTHAKGDVITQSKEAPAKVYDVVNNVWIEAKQTGWNTVKSVPEWTMTFGDNATTMVPSYDVAHYGDTLAGLGAAFATLLIGSMFTTVWFAYTKKRGGNK